jgi:hypothetical protein
MTGRFYGAQKIISVIWSTLKKKKEYKIYDLSKVIKISPSKFFLS